MPLFVPAWARSWWLVALVLPACDGGLPALGGHHVRTVGALVDAVPKNAHGSSRVSISALGHPRPAHTRQRLAT